MDPKAFKSKSIVDTWSWTVCATQSPLCTSSVGFVGIVTDDRFAVIDLSLGVAIFSTNIKENADIMSAFLCRAASVANEVIKSSLFSTV